MTAIKGFQNLSSIKVDEDLMITVVTGDKDTVATRELLDIPNPALHTIHKNNKLFSLPIRWIILKGSATHSWYWEDEIDITKEDLEELEELNKDDTLKNSPNYLATNLDNAIADKKYGFTYTYDCPFNTLTPTQVKYQPICKGQIEALQDDTRYLCTITNNKNYKSYILDIPKNEIRLLGKMGETDYVFFSGSCEIEGIEIPENTTKKLTSQTINIKNVSDRDIRIVLISK